MAYSADGRLFVAGRYGDIRWFETDIYSPCTGIPATTGTCYARDPAGSRYRGLGQ